MDTRGDTHFWKNFTQRVWENKSIVAKNFTSPLRDINHEQIFEMLVEYSARCRKQKSADGFKLYVDGHRLHLDEVLQFLPSRRDKSLIGYHERMGPIFSDYCLVCDELLQVSKKTWQPLFSFTKNLFSHVGFPNQFVELGLYLGNYKKTPFGVHVDGCGVFSFPIVGNKIFRIWAPNFVKKHPELDRALNYTRFKKDSQILKAAPGDMAYWPSSAWHIAESNGSFSATWSLGVWVDRPHHANVESAVRPLLLNTLGPSANETMTKGMPITKDGHIKSLPKNYLESILRFKEITSNELHDAFMCAWLQLISKQGFKTFPRSPTRGKLTMKSRIRLETSEVIMWAQLKSRKKLLLAFKGTTLEIAASKNLLRLITMLNTGVSCRISDYLIGSQKLSDLQSFNALLRAQQTILIKP